MNKLVLNPHGRNHFKFFPDKNREIPVDEKEQIELVESIYNDLVEKGKILYTKTKSGSHCINSVKLENEYFIVVSIRNEFRTYNNTIYEISNENDAIVIGKFIGKNIKTTMADYKKQILDAKKMHVERKEEEQNDKEKEN